MWSLPIEMSAEPTPIASSAGPAVADAGREGPRSLSDLSSVSRLIRVTGLVGVLFSLVSVGVTFFVLTGLTPLEPSPEVVRITMAVNGGLVGFLILIVAWEIGSLLVARRRGKAASRLHIRIVAVLSLIAAVPAALLAVTASTTLDRGLDNWFSVRTRAIVDNSLSIAQAYAEQQTLLLRADIRAAKAEFQRAGDLLLEAPEAFDDFFRSIAREQSLSGAFLMDSDGTVLREAPFSAAANSPPGADVLAQAGSQPDRVFIIPPGPENMIGAVTKLVGLDNVFLYGSRPLSADTARYLAMTNASVLEYHGLEASRSNMQIAFGILFLGITLVVLLSAIWLGIGFANRLVAPIRDLIDAANEVSRGNLEAAVKPRSSDGDVGALGTTFNTMTSQLRNQRQELVSASELMDRRRLFTEAVLSGVTAGVAGVDAAGKVTIANRTALRLLDVSNAEAVGRPIVELLPQLDQVVTAALRDGRPEHRDQINIMRQGRERTINARVTTERSKGHSHGYVITLDDITDLVTAQRSSAWADIARRIAHEIKNPLTPIQLSAERLKRKFGQIITEDRDVFDQCTETIIRQVSDIGRMVDEFSSFARMPKPVFEVADLAPTIREAAFLVSVSKPDITFDIELPETPLRSRFDPRLIGQVLANIIKNATEAIEALADDRQQQGRVVVSGHVEGRSVSIEITDNGVGLPADNRQKLLEPYMTTREKGTGLGLAIATKIIEEHGGRIELLDAPAVAEGGTGAMVRIMLPLTETPGDLAPLPSIDESHKPPA